MIKFYIVEIDKKFLIKFYFFFEIITKNKKMIFLRNKKKGNFNRNFKF